MRLEPLNVCLTDRRLNHAPSCGYLLVLLCNSAKRGRDGKVKKPRTLYDCRYVRNLDMYPLTRTLILSRSVNINIKTVSSGFFLSHLPVCINKQLLFLINRFLIKLNNSASTSRPGVIDDPPISFKSAPDPP